MRRSRGGRKRSLPPLPGPEGGHTAAAAAAKRVATSPSGGRMVNFCPQCGQRVETVFNFCPSCGGRLPPQEEEPMQITPTPSLKAKLSSRSPRKDRSAFVKPLPEGQILTDLNNKQWILKKLLSQNDHGIMYEAQSASGACPPKQRYTLKLDCKEGRIFNEQNFLQRAAKKVSVEKWKKQHLVPLLGIPECVGFGLHNGCYRFLVFSDLGRSLQSILDDCANKMTEKAAMQLAIRLVTLADYCFSFRYSPGGKHVPQREGSRTPHEGNLEFISLDSHKGAAPSRRSDLESLGYCLVKWVCGCLPWSEELANPCTVMEKKERYKSDVIKHPRLSYVWKAIPEALQGYLLQVMPLEYDEKPNYEELRTLLRKPLQLMRTDAYDSVDLRVAP